MCLRDRQLIAGVGYHNLRDLSLGPVLIEQLRQDEWPLGVDLEDFSYGPIGVMHHLDACPQYDRIIFVAGVKRDRQPGRIYCYRWEHHLPDPDDIQERVAEAITGVVSLDNLLIIATYFGKLPQDVIVIEVEAADELWGEGFTPVVEQVMPELVQTIREYVREA